MQRHHLDLLLNLVRKELTVRYMGSMLGGLWSLGNPLVTVLVYWFVFSHIFVPPEPHFTTYLIVAVVHWLLFAQVLSASCDWLTGNAALLRKVSFPWLLIPLSGISSVLVTWFSGLVVVVAAWKLLGGSFALSWFIYPVVLAAFLCLIFGTGVVLSVLNVQFRDIRHLVDVGLPLAFWLTPIVWVPSQIPPQIARWLELNPLGAFFRSFANLLHRGQSPDLRDLAIAVVSGAVALVAGLALLRARRPSLVEIL